MSRIKKFLIITLSIIFVLIGSTFIYTADYYHGDEKAASLIEKAEKIDGAYVIYPDNPKAGLIFYPGGKVEDIAYLPLMDKLANEGILCVLLHEPLNLAILDVNKADGYKDLNNDIDWYLGGHSLGGTAASMYMEKHPDEYKGIMLLGAYSSGDLKDTDVKALLIYGSNDEVMNRNRYAKATNKLPSDYCEVVIEGGNHCGFGNYGFQKGDGQALITSDNQQEETVKAFIEHFSIKSHQ